MSRSPEDMYATVPSPRVERLRAYYINAAKGSEPNYNIFSDLAIARVMKQTEGEPMALRRAKAFAAVVEAAPVDIFPDEPFVGWVAGDPVSVQISAEQRGSRMEIELDHYRFINDEDRRILQEEIIPYWKGDGNWKRHWFARAYQLLPPETRKALYGDPDPREEKIGILTNSNPPAQPRVDVPGRVKTLGMGIITDLMSRHHIGHSCFGYEKVLKKGFSGIKRDAEERIARLNVAEPEDMKKTAFLKGVIIAMEAAARIGTRFAARARDMAAEESDSARKKDLLTIADTCDRVPAHPARTFREALQSVWFTQIMNWWETPLILSVSPGRVDQYLRPYYESDIREGRLTKDEAQELIDCWLMRFAQGVAPFVSHSGAAFHIDVGGFKADGSDATNELSFMFLEGMMHTRMIEPNIGVLIHSKTPDDFLIKACRLCSLGTGHPMFLNNDVFVENLLSRGTLGGPPVPLELARTSGAIGCNEPHVANYESDHNVGAIFQMPIVLELVLFNGMSRFHKKLMGLETGEATEFQNFEDLLKAFERQLAYMVGHCGAAIRAFELAMAEVYPTVYQSALIEDCIEKGVSREDGGARFNFGPCVATLGATDVGDSLAAIKKLVFEEKRITMEQLIEALETDFEDREEIRQLLLKAPKFGNDDDYVDRLVAWVMDVFSREVIRHKNTRGGHVLPYQNPLSGYVGMGRLMGALPSGRKAGEPLSDGISPTRGSDVNGPTAVLNSAGKIDNASIFLGETLNLRLSPDVVAADEGVYRLAALLRTFVDLKIHHIQFNLVSSATLRAAQEKPEEYQDLMVRVAGYVAYFVNLSKGLQDSIIARTEHAL
ncbi:glycyl radical protein [Desulfomonile tiedjei]|uniref:Pyruvate-formate lyase n=1 Tax=Desulfomonile tiedjei (strain ATCC 49306 / DSM 6799 / DCB-1) TaxID=706587 RepID=I4C5J8_DESTA|nr:pyruvate formate lyase family protein [Desulfomonile tiedjei]AFM24839.1 pyruvate-formate lyase [Desulfomonile tiedjei DSM 6799]